MYDKRPKREGITGTTGAIKEGGDSTLVLIIFATKAKKKNQLCNQEHLIYNYNQEKGTEELMTAKGPVFIPINSEKQAMTFIGRINQNFRMLGCSKMPLQSLQQHAKMLPWKHSYALWHSNIKKTSVTHFVNPRAKEASIVMGLDCQGYAQV